MWLISFDYCIDAVNNANCNFDSDCCDPNANTDYCHDCICYEDLNCNGPLDLIGNGYCNDQTNNVECNFDGGDCCGSCANMEQCSECQCLGGSPPNYLCKLSNWKTIYIFIDKMIWLYNINRSKNWGKNIQTMVYNSTRSVYHVDCLVYRLHV